MPSWAQDSYLTTAVMTATPQKTQLMLIEGAIRFGQRARHQWDAGEEEAACESLIRAQEIVGHILCNLESSPDRDLARKVASIYVFVFRSLAAANYRRDAEKLEDALRVLGVERETWRQVCEQAGNAKGDGSTPAETALPSHGTGTPPGAALPLCDDMGDVHVGLSLEA